MAAEDLRVEVELDDEEYGFSLWERLRALHLDDEARRRLGESIVVTRDGSRLFLYAADATGARAAERVIRDLVEEDALSAEIRVTRWHPVEEEWIEASIPLPRTEAEEQAEYEAREDSETREAEAEGEFDWQVVVHVPSRDDAADLADRLAADGVAVARRWRYVVVGAVTEEHATELADRIRAEVPNGSEVSVEANVADVPGRPFEFVGF